MNFFVLGFGTNCGNRLAFLRTALQKIKAGPPFHSLKILKVSPIYESDALLPEGAPESWKQDFLNVNVSIHTTLSPLALLDWIKTLEKSMGRIDRGRWAPREIDIDILVMGPQGTGLFKSDRLTIPHPELHHRPFATLPLMDLLPDWGVSPWKGRPSEHVPFLTHRTQYALTELVGIINVTPDSFSDGGLFNSADVAVQQAERFLALGVTILDIGAEATNPSTAVKNHPITPVEEWKRLEPVLAALRGMPITLSLDTRHAEVAKNGILAGVHWINDVSGFSDPAMVRAVTQSSQTSGTSVDLVMMHSLVVPADPRVTLSLESDPVSQILGWTEKRLQELEAAGIARERIIFDPGFGFGLTVEQSWVVLREIERFHDLGIRILVGHSRKSFLTSITNSPAPARDLETATLSVTLANKGMNYLRVHDAETSSRTLKCWTQVDGVSQW